MPDRPALPRRAAAEAMAAFALIFCVGGAAAAEASSHAELGLPAQAAVSGLAIMALVYAVGHLSGAHMNPARSFGPALASWTWNDFWVWVVGPIAGATLGGFAYQFIRAPRVTAATEHA